MKPQKQLFTIILIVLSAVLLDACSFSVEVLSTPTAVPPTVTAIHPTATSVPFTLVPPSATPTLISIRSDTLSMLQIFMSVDGRRITAQPGIHAG